MTFMFSVGRWFGFYIRTGYLVRIGLGIIEIAFSFGERGGLSNFVESVMQGSGEAANEIVDDPMKTGHKFPVGFVSLVNGQPAEVRVELESNQTKFLIENGQQVGESV